jgi:hypothetical protein
MHHLGFVEQYAAAILTPPENTKSHRLSKISSSARHSWESLCHLVATVFIDGFQRVGSLKKMTSANVHTARHEHVCS